MKLIQPLLISLAITACSASAASIVWVSDQLVGTGGSDNNQSPNGTFTGGAGPYADQAILNLLAANGHTVTRYNPADSANVMSAADVATMNTFDLVILGRSLGSGSFDTAVETLPWNTGITRPLISTNTYMSRSNRLGWFSTTGGPVQPDQVLNPLTFTNTADPVQAYLIGSSALSGSTTVDTITDQFFFPADGAADIRGISNLTGSTINPGGTLIATSFISATSLNGAYIASLPAGTVLSTTGTGNVAAGQTLGGYRLQFLVGVRESASAPNTGVGNAGYENLTPEGEAMFLRAVLLAANNGVVPIPEPATLTLAGLAGLSLLRRRRV